MRERSELEAAEPQQEESVEAAHGPLAAALLRLQATAGNRAVTRRIAARRALLQRQPADAPVQTTLTPASSSGPAVPGRSKVVEAPPPVRNVPATGPPVEQGGDDNVHPAVDLAADARTVTVSFVLRNFNLPQSGDTSSIDFLHEPSVSIQVTPGTPQPVVQAAIAAINAHLRRHGRDLVEVSVSPQASLDSSGRPAVGAQAQAEIHVTASASLTVASSVSAAPGGGDVDPGSLRLNRPGAAVDLTWSPVSIGVLYHLDAQDRRPDSGPQLDYEALRSDARIINWVVGQLDRADFTSPGAGELDVSTFVTQLLDAMRRAGGEEAQWNIHIGALQVADFPSGLTRGLTRAAQLVAVASPDVAGVRRVRVSVLNLPRDGNGPERVARWMLLQLDREAVTPAAAPPAR